MKIAHNILSLIGHTPLVELSRYSTEHKLEARLVAKVEGFTPSGSVKARAALAMIEDAGITTTGAFSGGNQLPTLQEEYKAYRTTNELWKESNSFVSYTINADGKILRKSDGKEVELKW